MEYGPRREMPAEVREHIQTLAGLVAQPQFATLLEEIEKAPEDDRPEVAQRLATVSALRERRIPVPEGLRITTRVFENPDDPRILATSIVDDRAPGAAADLVAARPTLCVSIGFIVCVTIGDEV
jgi:hypothetical protein